VELELDKAGTTRRFEWMKRRRGFDKNILKPTRFTQRVDVGCDLRLVELFTGADRETRHCCCCRDAVKTDKFDFVDYSMRRKTGGTTRVLRNQGIGLWTRSRGSGNQQPEKKTQLGERNRTSFAAPGPAPEN